MAGAEFGFAAKLRVPFGAALQDRLGQSTANEERDDVFVVERRDEAGHAEVDEEIAAQQQTRRFTAEHKVHVHPQAGAAGLDAHFNEPVTGLKQWFASPIHDRNHTQPERLREVDKIVENRKILIVGAQPRPLA